MAKRCKHCFDGGPELSGHQKQYAEKHNFGSREDVLDFSIFFFFSDIILHSKESLAGLVRSPELLLYSVKSIKENKQ